MPIRKLDNLIFDRTEQDLVEDTDKAYISYTDLNRIEEACSYLAKILNVSIKTKVWTMEEFRYSSEMVRLRDNIKKLQDSYYKKKGTPIVPTTIRYENITEANNIEKILYDIEDMWLKVRAGCHKLSFHLSRRPIGNRKVV